ncbi:MAG TPA: MBL fold metallo-hydrolase [Chromatiaceae bacterium]|jgi:glyoxylase-like metal-dependent hydrolase (beta-lactamase superfamily II)|nr:MBL fold metallo-hydrolase [Chromatiaceae bacterium]HIN81836.1 MBL fold metallo-hydrolase [Chromatiales bacterium]HIA08039.1 MBL fold metallo-hydrolase [Chromatiaceae bacterium]HIB84771.1 MBL fold metallo-hydrolase [Chromatiaceae bacterium]HIO15173.1 MBL fold metallo-hydrolase [Chromatiales bacterium]
MQIKTFFDKRTFTLTYVIYDSATQDAVLIDPVLDYDPAASKVWTESVDSAARFIQDQGLTLHFILESHAHADHLSGAQMLKESFPDAKLAVGKNITVVQAMFKTVFGLPDDFPTDGRQFDRLLEDNEIIEAGSLRIKTLFTPGHTPACASYLIDDAVFTGDALFMPDMGTGRCDFPAGSAHDLYHSVTTRLYTLPDSTRVFVGHDYQPGGRELAYETTIAVQKASNIQLAAATDELTFTEFRSTRDKTLAAPRLLFQSVQINIDAGSMPDAETNDKRYLKIPVNIFRPQTEGKLELEKI